MNDLEMKINSLSEKITAMRRKTELSTKLTAIIYIILVIFVFAYTSTIMSMLKKNATADSISAIISSRLNKDLFSDSNRKWVLSSCKANAPVLADALVKGINDRLIPGMENRLKQLIDAQVDDIIVRIEKDIFPELSNFVKEHATELSEHKDITDEKVAKELALILAKEFDREMGKFINNKLRYRMLALRKQLDKISSKPYSQLTAKEAAERSLIINWIFLMEHHESPANVLGEMLGKLNNTYDEFMKRNLQLK